MRARAFSSERVVTPEGVRPAAIIVEGESIRTVVSREQIPTHAEAIDFGQSAILPGLVDTHVHINEPGRTDWEGFATGSCAAAAGGCTCLVDMPLNCLPATTTPQALELKRASAAKSSRVDFAFWGGVVHDNQQSIEMLVEAGVAGFKCFLVHPGIDGFTMVTEPQLRAALPHIAESGLPLLVHAELPGPIEAVNRELQDADWRKYQTYLRSRPDEAELQAIGLMIRLCREFRFRLHIVHLATGQAVDLLRSAKNDGLPITVETCPHYLCFCAEEVPHGATLFKCAPPIRTAANRHQLWEALAEGVIDLIATDHSPCPPEMKRLDDGNFQTAWGGIASLSVALPAVWTEAKQRGYSLTDIARWMSEKPAQLAGCAKRKGKIAAGYDADFVIFDPEREFMVDKNRLYQRHRISPYLGRQMCGVVQRTYLRGECVFDHGEFRGDPVGREVALRPARLRP